MKRKPRFLIVLLTAGLTFGTLMATVGPRHLHRPGHCHTTEGSVHNSPAETTAPAGSTK